MYKDLISDFVNGANAKNHKIIPIWNTYNTLSEKRAKKTSRSRFNNNNNNKEEEEENKNDEKDGNAYDLVFTGIYK